MDYIFCRFILGWGVLKVKDNVYPLHLSHRLEYACTKRSYPIYWYWYKFLRSLKIKLWVNVCLCWHLNVQWSTLASFVQLQKNSFCYIVFDFFLEQQSFVGFFSMWFHVKYHSILLSPYSVLIHLLPESFS